MRTIVRLLLGCCIFMACSGSAADSQFQSQPFLETAPQTDLVYGIDRSLPYGIDESKIRLPQAAMIFNPFVAVLAVLLGVRVQEQFLVAYVGGPPITPDGWAIAILFGGILELLALWNSPGNRWRLSVIITIIILLCAAGYLIWRILTTFL